MSAAVMIYTTSWCGPCRRLRSQLDREGIAYDSVDIELDEQAAAFVRSANNGNQTVPTVRVPVSNGEDIVMTNPTVTQVKDALARASAAA